MSSTHQDAELYWHDGGGAPPPRAHVPKRDGTKDSDAGPRPAGTVRRAPSRAVVWSDPDAPEVEAVTEVARLAPSLTLRTETTSSTTFLHLSGSLEIADLLRLREAAFTIIGARPPALCLDVRLVSRIEFAGINTLLTIGRVAKLARIPFTVRASAILGRHLRETGLARTLTLDESLGTIENSETQA